MIDIRKAHEEFDRYLSAFDCENDKIKLKIIHTNGVVACAREIAGNMGLPEEDVQLAELIALLHDIGRFEQVARFDSFDPRTMDHASYGVDILFGKSEQLQNNAESAAEMEEPMIRRFLESDQWDDIIGVAIGEHNKFQIEGDYDERTLLHAKLIRDADKLDNCRVKLEEDIHILLGMDEASAGTLPITDSVWASCMRCESVVSTDRVTMMDRWVSYVAYFFDINFRETFETIDREHFVERTIDRIPYSNPDTKAKMEYLRGFVSEFVSKKAKGL